MRDLKIVILSPEAERFRGAITIAAAHAALGGHVAMLLQADAVSLLTPARGAPNDAAHALQGLPTLGTLVAEALALGVIVIACQSGLGLARLSLSDLDPRIVAGGPVSFMQQLADTDRLLLI
jgi:predicted peroxiredoxin